ncbi:MAG: patatin-like phospholipase family protein [Anaerolineaceae bacterium]|nr:patatin-like phospholipase family protein [Anaerolineaceae bacterium]
MHQPLRVLILSGGGGRGGFHVGAYQYLHEHDWQPEIIIGTSIGAVNGALITSGYTPAQLRQFWLGDSRNTNAPNLCDVGQVEGIPPNMGKLSQMVIRQLMRQTLQDRLEIASPSASPTPPANWRALPEQILDEDSGKIRTGLFAKLVNQVFGQSCNLLDTGPLKATLGRALGLADDKTPVAPDQPILLLINATNVRSGEHTVFSNRGFDGARREHLLSGGATRYQQGITLKHLMASASIPLVYPWTEIDGEYYWDGAIVNNTPLGIALDAAAQIDPKQERPLEIYCVLSSPWKTPMQQAPSADQLPDNFVSSISFALDWMLLSSFREQLNLLRGLNRLTRRLYQSGQVDAEVLPRLVQYKIVAPQPERVYSDQSQAVWRIIDYDRPQTEALIRHGYAQTAERFHQPFEW